MNHICKRVSALSIACLLLLTLCMPVHANNSFTGTIQLDELSEETIDLSNIEIQVYAAAQRPSEGDSMEFDEEYSFSVFPDADGSFTFTRPTTCFSISIDLSTLPDGTGIDRHTVFYLPDQIEDSFVLSEIESAKIVSGTNEVNKITYFNPDGKEIFAQGELVSPLTAINMSADSEQLIFEGMVDCGKIIPVTESIDLSDFSEYDKNSYLYEHGYISEEEKIENYCTLLENGVEFTDNCLTPVIGEIVEYYETHSQQKAALSEQVLGFIDPLNNITINNEAVVSNDYFSVHYDSSKINRTIANQVLTLFSSARSTAIARGFNAARNESGKSTYQIYLSTDPKAPNSLVAGTTYLADPTGNTSASYIVLWRMTNNIDEKLKETIYHEYFHAVECTYNRNTNSTFGEASSDWFASSCSGFSSISAGHLKDYMRLSYKCILDHNEEYGVSCFLFAIQKAYGGTKVVRKIWENLNNASVPFTNSELYNAITSAILNYNSSGNASEALKKCAAWSQYAEYFYKDLLSGNSEKWTFSGNYASNSTAFSQSESLDPMSFYSICMSARSTTTRTVTVTVDFSRSGSNLSSVRTLKVSSDGTITPIGGDVPSGRYSVVIPNFNLNSGIKEIRVVGIDADLSMGNTVSITVNAQ